jgi:8-oxo-dGTP pyrophosphatase MutT (NUDIX family)
VTEEQENQILDGWDASLPPQDRSAGGVVFRPYIRKKDGKPGFLVGLIERSQSGWWDLPKGHLEKGETEEQAAIREVEEESGLNGEIVLPLGEARYLADSRRGNLRKQVRWFLMRDLNAKLVKPRPQPGETHDAIWCDLDEAIALVYFENARVILRRARRVLTRGDFHPALRPTFNHKNGSGKD